MKIFKRIYRRLVKTLRFSLAIPLSIGFAFRNRSIRRVRKIIYIVTPPPYLPNIGDHAQIIAIRRWMKKHFPDLPVIELDMDQCKWYLPAIRWLIHPEDLIFCHSGGNLGDRGIWCESRRRLYIRAFPKNRIISLPQTIYFSNTPFGRREEENTRRIYAAHQNLTIIARDPRSGEVAGELFPRAATFCIPDFVLALPPLETDRSKKSGKVLLCLRQDIESALTAEDQALIPGLIPYRTSRFDTTFSRAIKVKDRDALLAKTLDYFSSFDAIITDRYHGVIFAVICRIPCLVLPTVDHKLTSSIHWFDEIPFVIMARNLAEIPGRLEECLAAGREPVPDWNRLYFDTLPSRLELDFHPVKQAADAVPSGSGQPGARIDQEYSP